MPGKRMVRVTIQFLPEPVLGLLQAAHRPVHIANRVAQARQSRVLRERSLVGFHRFFVFGLFAVQFGGELIDPIRVGRNLRQPLYGPGRESLVRAPQPVSGIDALRIGRKGRSSPLR